MTIDELKDKHKEVASYYWADWTPHTKLSIEFTISVLEECVGTKNIDYMKSLAVNDTVSNNIYNKIQELKTYLDAES